jgi:hypothetical protein
MLAANDVAILYVVCCFNCIALQVGLRKLLDAEGEVNVMKQELIALQPKLIETGVHKLLL